MERHQQQQSAKTTLAKPNEEAASSSSAASSKLKPLDGNDIDCGWRRSSVSCKSSNDNSAASNSFASQHRKQSLDELDRIKKEEKQNPSGGRDEGESLVKRKLGPIKSLNSSSGCSSPAATTTGDELFSASTSTSSSQVQPQRHTNCNDKNSQAFKSSSQTTTEQKPSTSKTNSTAGNSESQGQTNKQMFSFKQLALNSRNLAKKRGSLQQQQQQAKLQDKCKQLIKLKSNKAGQSSNSQSNSSSDSSDTIEQQRQKQTSSQLVTLDSSDIEYPENRDHDECDSLVSEDSYDFDDSDFDDDYDYDYGDEEDDDDEEDYEFKASESSKLGERRMLLAKKNSVYAKSSPPSAVAAENKEQKLKKKKKRRQSQLQAKRGSCCNCEPFVHRVDFDGQLITDVDLVTYKHLCQMEHEANHRYHNHQLDRRLFGLHQQQQQSTARNQVNLTSSDKMDRLKLPSMSQSTRSKSTSNTTRNKPLRGRQLAKQATTFITQKQFPPDAVCRRSSLQEESGAYYQLCTSQEEQLIRSKYLWFPPSLKTLLMVDKFFQDFQKDKVPLVSASSGLQQQHQQQQQSGSRASKQTPGGQCEQPAATLASASIACANPAAASLVGCYRDEQISFQLPRQDISLDYCSYHMDEMSRASFAHFIDKRNTQALDVGTVVQISCPFVANSAPATTTTTGGDSGANQLARLRESNRKTSNATSGQLQPTNGITQRCRRCLVRFDDGQLAVLAPNFVIGTKLPLISTATLGDLKQQHQIAASVANSRRASIVSSVSCLTMQENQLAGPMGASGNKGQAALDPMAIKQQPHQNVAMFHPQCFTCSTCKEFLVDLVYCLRDGRLYCLRHYGESLRPRCDWCQELIFSDEYLKAMNENFHVDHFLCRHCDSNLAGQRYVLKEEKPYCIQCYEGNFANTCEDCQKPIGIDSKDLSYKEKHWHDSCFVCHKCQESLIDKPFGWKSDRVYCANCYDVAFATRCDGCSNPFRAGSRKMEYRGRQWHDSCFCCCVCQTTIGSNSFIPKNDEIYCIKCYEDKYATRCTKCKQVIISGGVTFRNEPWHRECFNCCHCQKSLAGQRFTTRDTNNSETTTTTNTTSKTNNSTQSHNAYCIDCYGELFAKKCFACSKAITGLGGTRFVTFEERSWHNDCFICQDCQTSLVGKGFITDGPEAILCGECARAKLR